MYVDEAQEGLSFRNARDLLLVGGGGHRTGKRGGAWRELREFARRYYPGATEKYQWATQDCMSLDGVPYIGPYSSSTSYVATGFNKWGMTSSMVSAMLLSDLVGKTNLSQRCFRLPAQSSALNWSSMDLRRPSACWPHNQAMSPYGLRAEMEFPGTPGTAHAMAPALRRRENASIIRPQAI